MTEVAPEVRVLSHRADAMVRAGSDDAGFAPLFSHDPPSEVVDVPEALWAARLDHYNHPAVSDSLPEGLKHKLTSARVGDLL